MIHSVKVTNYLGESLVMELAQPKKSGFIIYNMTGIGPSKADINASDLSTLDGSVFSSSRLTKRNILIYVKYLGTPSIEDTRQKSYKYFPVKKKLTLTFKTDNREASIDGFVESNEPVIFSSEEYAQISIICPDPYFYSTKISSIIFNAVEGLFEFPFSNESLSEKLIIFGNMRDTGEQNILYEGDSEIGITITINAVGPATNIRIYRVESREIMHIDTSKIKNITGAGILAGDIITISTVKGEKFMHLYRGGIYYNIINALDKNTDWIQLSKGNNIFTYTAESGASNIELSIEHKTAFEGI